MNRLMICFGLLLVAGLPAAAQAERSIASIPVALLANADAVVRYDETSFEILSKSQARLRRRLVVTVLNENGERDHAQLYVRYDKFTKIVSLEGTVYDSAGKPVYKLKNADIHDYGYGAFSDMITDARLKIAEFGKKRIPYPYTVEFSYETRERNMMFYPSWTPEYTNRTAVERAAFRVKVPDDMDFRFKILNEAPEVEKSTGKETWYTWTAGNRQALAEEVYGLPERQRQPMVLTAPSTFEIQGYNGDFTSWGDFGKFYSSLNRNRDVLPEKTITELKALTAGLQTDEEKIRTVYEWMQSRTRYVSIQLGIGGWQTIDAQTVATKGYGDCKALTNYYIALLRQVGVTAYPTLIKAGSGAEIIPDFPSNQFNHVIACAPVAGGDTIWLECTSQVEATGFLGTFTGNRYALLVTPEGGKLVRTPGYLPADNRRIRSSMVALQATGDARVSVETSYYGTRQEQPSGVIHGKTADEQEKWLLKNLGISGADLTAFAFAHKKEGPPVVKESLELTIRRFATRTGSRYFIKPSFLNRVLNFPVTGEERRTDFYLDPDTYHFTDIDSVQILLPANLNVESSIAPVRVTSKFGVYEADVKMAGNSLTYCHRLSMTGGRYPAADYPEWIEFIKKIRREGRSQLVLVEK